MDGGIKLQQFVYFESFVRHSIWLLRSMLTYSSIRQLRLSMCCIDLYDKTKSPTLIYLKRLKLDSIRGSTWYRK